MPPTFALDEDISPRLAEALKILGEDVVWLPEECGRGTPDLDWMPVAAHRAWTIVTADASILKRPSERAAYVSHGLGVFFIPNELTRCEQVQFVIRYWPEMKRLARNERRPFGYKLTRKGLQNQRIGRGSHRDPKSGPT